MGLTRFMTRGREATAVASHTTSSGVHVTQCATGAIVATGAASVYLNERQWRELIAYGLACFEISI